MIRSLVPLLVCAVCGWAESAASKGLTVTFNGAMGLEIRTESTRANSPLSTSGSVSISDQNQVSRTVVDGAGRLLFIYDIEMAPESGVAQRYSIRIRPHDPNRIDLAYFVFAPGDQLTIGEAAYTVRSDGTIAVGQIGDLHAAGLTPERLAALVRERGGSRVKVKVTSARRDVPTVSAVREFRYVRLGEAVSIDILANPATGERIYDVIQPIQPAPQSFGAREPGKAAEDEFSLLKPRYTVNGKPLETEGDIWMIGAALKIALPGHGTVYLAVQPVTSYPFQPVGRAERNRLTFPLGGDFVEITGAENVMTKAAYRTIWVYWDASAPNTRTVDVTCSGTLDGILPKK